MQSALTDLSFFCLSKNATILIIVGFLFHSYFAAINDVNNDKEGGDYNGGDVNDDDNDDEDGADDDDDGDNDDDADDYNDDDDAAADDDDNDDDDSRGIAVVTWEGACSANDSELQHRRQKHLISVDHHRSS